MSLAFRKMHGLGNDFVVIDARSQPFAAASGILQFIADRRRGIGCDQIIVLEKSSRAPAFMRIYNPDGSEAGACGNATRCIGALLMKETGLDLVEIETRAGLLSAKAADHGRVRVDMGAPKLRWKDIPLLEEHDTLNLPFSLGPLNNPTAVSMGNPHVVFFMPDVKAVDLLHLGPQIEHHPLFPERTNVEIVQVLSATRLRMRVWERGAGITQACGTGACAALVAAVRRELTTRQVTVEMPGGEVEIEWLSQDHVYMTGDWAESFTGVFSL